MYPITLCSTLKFLVTLSNDNSALPSSFIRVKGIWENIKKNGIPREKDMKKKFI